MSDDRYILDGKSFVDTKTNQCLNFGIKDLVRVTITLNNMDMWLNQQDQRIAELEEQLKNAIVPKFKIGQEVWSIFESQYFRDCKELCNLEITAIMKTNKGIFYQGYVLEKGKNMSDYWFNEKKTFLTKEEAQAKLKELQGDK